MIAVQLFSFTVRKRFSYAACNFIESDLMYQGFFKKME